MDALLGMEIASPDDLKPAITSVAETVGTIMNLMLGDSTAGKTAGKNDTANDTVEVSDDPCDQIPVIDKVSRNISLKLLNNNEQSPAEC